MLNNPSLASYKFATKSVTFDGTAGLGAQGAVPLFTVTGEIIVVYLVPYVVLTLGQDVGTPTLALGVTNSTGLFIGATTATALATGEFWTEATGGGTAAAGVGLPAAGPAAPGRSRGRAAHAAAAAKAPAQEPAALKIRRAL